MTTIGPYELEAQIGAGGFAEVYRSTHPVLGVPVAIKLLHADVAALPTTRERMLQEARLTLRLRHPGIVHMFDVGEDGERLYLVMELLHSQNLRAQLEQARPSTAQALGLVRDLAGALAYAHAQGVLHRDLKPENILLRDGRHVIADFGLAQPLLDDDARITRPGSIMGTPAYMAPEQLQGRSTDRRTDVYALGVMLFEMLTGTAPFGYSPRSASYGNLNTPAPRLRSLDERVPPALDNLVAAMLAKDPSQRPPDMGSVVRSLSSILEQAANGAEPLPDYIRIPVPVAQPATRPVLHHVDAQYERFKPARNVILGVFALMLVLCAGVYVLDYWLDNRPATPVPVEVTGDLTLIGPRSSELGQDRFTLSNFGVRRSGDSAFISGLLRNDMAELQSNIEVIAIGRDASGKEVWSGANTVYGDELEPGAVTPFSILVEDGAQVPDDTGKIEFQARGEPTSFDPGRVPLQAKDVAVERRGARYAVTGTLLGAAQDAHYPAVEVILFDDEGAVLQASLVNLPKTALLAANAEQSFSVDVGSLRQSPARVYADGRGRPGQ